MPAFLKFAFRHTVIAAIAAGVLGAQATKPRSLEVVWSVGGGDDASTSFAVITLVVAGPTNDVVVWDQRTPALRLYNDAGKLVKTIGRKGGGPGEYDAISGIAYAPDGRLYVWDSGNARINIYKTTGDFDTSYRLPIAQFSTTDGLRIDAQNRAWLSFVIFDREHGSTTRAWIRLKAVDGTVIDTVKAPQFEGSDPQLVAQSKGSMSSQSIPYGRYPIVALSASGELLTAPGNRYEITTRYKGKALKIEHAYTAVPVLSAERDALKASIENNLRSIQADWRWPSADVPSLKPPIQSMRSAADGRIWVTLNVPTESYKDDPPRGSPPGTPQVTRYRDSMRKWDVFEPDGRFLGTVATSTRIFPRAMRGDFAWGLATDENDLPTLVKLKVTPGFGAR